MNAPKPTTGKLAIDAAMAAGFGIVAHGVDRYRNRYVHVLAHADGRELAVNTALGNGRFLSANGRNRSLWNTTRLYAGSVPAIARLLTGK